MSERKYLTPNQIDRMLGIQKGKTLGWIHAGELPAVNLAKDANGQRPRWRVAIADLEAFLASRAATPPEPPKPARRRRKSSTRQWV